MEADGQTTARETFRELPPGWIVCSCLNCRSELRSPNVRLLPPIVCACGAVINIPPTQFTERLFADDEAAKDRILNIDLGIYDELVNYPGTDVDWLRERKKVLFLQMALKCDVPWAAVVQFTRPYFGQTLESPPVVAAVPINPPPFTPPAFDIARQTPEDWAQSFDEACKTYRDHAAAGFRALRQELIERGELRPVERPRRTSGIAGQKKAPIADETDVFRWAVLTLFSAQLGEPMSWAQLADMYPALDAPTHPAPAVAKAKRKRAEQIRTRATALLRDLGLPE